MHFRRNANRHSTMVTAIGGIDGTKPPPPIQHPPVTHSAIVLNARQPPLTPTVTCQLPLAASNARTPPLTPTLTRRLPLALSNAHQPLLTPSNAHQPPLNPTDNRSQLIPTITRQLKPIELVGEEKMGELACRLARESVFGKKKTDKKKLKRTEKSASQEVQ